MHAKASCYARRVTASLPDAYYESAALPEYWIVDPEKRHIEVLSLRQGRYQRHGLFASGETLGSPLLGGFGLEVLQVFGQRE